MTASFVDSNIWLYALVQKQDDKDEGKHELAIQVIQPGMTISEQVIAEVTANLIRKTDTSSQEITAYLKEFYSLYQVIYLGGCPRTRIVTKITEIL
jgi:predicted nucleic acid-binding protein